MQQGTELMQWLLGERKVSQAQPAFFHRAESDAPWSPLSWGQLQVLVEDAKRLLQSSGIGRGTVVGLLLPTCISWEVFHIACLDLGAIVVGLDTHDLGDNFRHIVGVSEVGVLIVDDATATQLGESRPAPIAKTLQVSLANEQSALSARVMLTGERPNDPLPSASWLADQTDDMATVVFTSGSTGKPKGIAYSRQQLVTAVSAILDAFPEIDDRARTVCWLPLSNLFQRVVNLCAMRVGAPVYFVSNPRALMQELPQIQPSVLIAVPRFFEKVFEGVRAKLEAMPLGSGRVILAAMARTDGRGAVAAISRWLCRRAMRPVREAFGGRIAFFISGSAPMPDWLLRNFDAMGMPVLEAYGLSENIVPIACNRVNARRRGSVGRVMSTNEVRVADDGELLCRGPGVCRKYLGTEDVVKLDQDGFLASGDYAEIDADGFVWLRGRKSEVFKTNTGRRISPVEIEAHLLDSGVADQAVVLGAGRKFLATLVTVKPGITRDGEQWLDAFRERLAASLDGLPEYKRPAGALVLSTPFSPLTGELTANLKLKRKAIEAKHQSAIDQLYTFLEADAMSSSTVATLDHATYMVRL